ncbi:DDE-type integrase/transposase/recombinase, partial [Rhizobium mongolense]|uniref:DDE-type integrase/transposase/recombinase n=1 Tax=Rhizobium mongolense TaxID=57676 RepID=UPI003F5FEB2C
MARSGQARPIPIPALGSTGRDRARRKSRASWWAYGEPPSCWNEYPCGVAQHWLSTEPAHSCRHPPLKFQWFADITFLHLAEEFAFLAVVLDAFSRRVVGWALDTHLRASLAIEALEMAITDRQPVAGSLVHHSDRGVQ